MGLRNLHSTFGVSSHQLCKALTRLFVPINSRNIRICCIKICTETVTSCARKIVGIYIDREESPYRPDLGFKLDDVKIDITTEKSLTEEIVQLLRAHWLFCTSSTPIEHVYALDESKLFAPDITVFGARANGELLGVGALRKLDSDHAELKSMHTLTKSRGQGIGKAIVEHIEEFAKGEGLKRISLETGATEPFKPARQLYKSLGFQECEAFGEYVLSEHNICMSKLI